LQKGESTKTKNYPTRKKVFSLFEPDTELLNRLKTPNPIEFGHRVLVVQDAPDLIIHSQI
jgi:hypothetical protein